MEVEINYLAVLLSTLASVILGFLWFGPLFGKQWMRLAGIQMPGEITKAMKKSMMRSYALMAITSFIMAAVLAHILFYITEFTDVFGVDTAITTALWAWLGFVVPATIGSVLWEDRPWKYWFITAGYWLVALVVAAAILAVWR